MGIKAPSCMTSLANAANAFAQSVKKTGVAAYNQLDQFAAKHPMVAAASGIALALLGSVVAAMALPLSPLSLGVAALAGGTLFGLGLKHLLNQSTKAQTDYSLFLGQKQPYDGDCVFSLNKQF